ncbi:MAG: dienelactone hydrolase family protein [Marinobacter sp.]|uniref:dienelactone hydrolase family protein n=1 Tax=Marinobacter sp. TaxID=50741 RepID=UPI00299E0C21|nr:dienelactone hydrolase family protein [Marinobacter sp.]MDX1635208.1 dienelactone hydrolase family protein [Marinobacter sp.]
MTRSVVTTEWIDITSTGGETFKGYLARPPAGTGPGILLIQEIFGVNHHIRTVAEQYALDGYLVLAPDVFWRQEPGVELGYDGEDLNKALKLVSEADFPNIIGDLARAADSLRQRPECEGSLASLGYCMGGILSYLTAAEGAVDRAVCFYPGNIARHLDKADRVRVPIQFHFAGQDAHITDEHVARTRQAFARHPDASVHVYKGADHGFNCWARGSYQRQAAALSHGRVLEFLERQPQPDTSDSTG